MEYKQDAKSQRYFGSYYYGRAGDKAYGSEGPVMEFPFDDESKEVLTLTFHFRFDSSHYKNVEELPLIQNTDSLIRAMEKNNWSFYYNFAVDISNSAIQIRYRKGHNNNQFYNNYKFDGEFRYDSLNNSISDFNISSVSKSEDLKHGDGILVQGDFSCILYNSKNFQDSMIFENIKYQGFVLFPYPYW